LILNTNHTLVQFLLENEEGENTGLICEELYDLARMQQAPLSADAMTKFVQRTNKILGMINK